jgi:hypothetical protein
MNANSIQVTSSIPSTINEEYESIFKFSTLNFFIGRALLCLILCTAVPHANAEEIKRLLGQIAASGPLSCTEGALHLFNEQIARYAPLAFLDGVKLRLGLGAEWGPGNKNFEQARVIVEKAINEDIASNGPLLSITADNLMATAFASKSIEEIRYFRDFFASPAGRLYWQSMIEGAQCANLLNSLEKPPFLPFTTEQKLHLQRLQEQLHGAEERFNVRFSALTKAEKNNFDRGYKKLGNNIFTQALIKLGTSDDETIKTRTKLAIQQYMHEIMQIILKSSGKD